MLRIVILLAAAVLYCDAQSSSYLFVCQNIDSYDCSSASQVPVCATNGVFYPNECEFIKAHCQDVGLDAAKPSAICSVVMTTAMPSGNMTTAMPSGNMTNVMTTAMPIGNMTNVMTTAMPSGNNMTNVMTTTMPIGNTTMTVNTTLSPLCQAVISLPCPLNDVITCGTDLIEYPSICEFTKAQCYDPAINVLQSGACPITTPRPSDAYDAICNFLLGNACADDGIVVCGSDGNTFKNTCEFEKAKCRNNTLAVLSIGSC